MSEKELRMGATWRATLGAHGLITGLDPGWHGRVYAAPVPRTRKDGRQGVHVGTAISGEHPQTVRPWHGQARLWPGLSW